MTSFVRKSAPIVALYWLLNFLFTYWFMREVFPTLTTKDREETKVILNLNTLKVIKGYGVSVHTLNYSAHIHRINVPPQLL